MALTADEQELLAVGKEAIPEIFRSDERTQEDLAAAAKIMGQAKAAIQHWLDMCRVSLATGPVSSEYVDWLALHAGDKGTARSSGESDAALKQRLWKIPGAIIRDDILGAAGEILAAGGVTGVVYMVELPKDQAFLGNNKPDQGVGGTFAKSGDTVTFTPSTKFAYPPFFGDISGGVKFTTITISGAANSGNNGAFQITGISWNGVTYSNALGAAGTDVTASWKTLRCGADNVPIDDGDPLVGQPRVFLGRGCRLWRGVKIGDSAPGAVACGFVMILPYGTPDSLRRSVAEMCRNSKAAGFKVIVERRETAP